MSALGSQLGPSAAVRGRIPASLERPRRGAAARNHPDARKPPRSKEDVGKSCSEPWPPPEPRERRP
eukprot:6323972-Pyramimonas_sp.AAC.1